MIEKDGEQSFLKNPQYTANFYNVENLLQIGSRILHIEFCTAIALFFIKRRSSLIIDLKVQVMLCH
jgi:hypothetical protein